MTATADAAPTPAPAPQELSTFGKALRQKRFVAGGVITILVALFAIPIWLAVVLAPGLPLRRRIARLCARFLFAWMGMPLRLEGGANLRGEGMAMAALAGAEIADPEFVQFHPTALKFGLDPAPLATEALRGEGEGLLIGNQDRTAF